MDIPAAVKHCWFELFDILFALKEQSGCFSTEIQTQLALGQELFHRFYNLGVELKANKQTIKDFPSKWIARISKYVADNQIWIALFLANYGYYRDSEIDLDGANPPTIICKVRSGVQFLFDDFSGHTKELDDVLTWLKENGEMDHFDESLKTWITLGVRDTYLDPKDINPNTPKHHWWWFDFDDIVDVLYS